MKPFIYISEAFYFPTYLLIISLTYTLGVLWVYFQAPRKGFDRGEALDICLMIMVGGFVGARAFHIVYENFDYYRMFPMEIFKFWQGGFVFYGGFVGALVPCIAYVKIKKLDFWKWADFFAPIFAVGYAFGRIGCLMNGCCFGTHCDLPWAVEFNQPGLPGELRHPTQLYATLWELFVALPVIVYVVPKIKLPKAGYQFLTWVFLHAIGRLMMEFFRDDYRGGAIFSLSISTWISFALIGGSLFLIYRRQAV